MAGGGYAQDFAALSEHGQFRAALIDPASKSLFLAVSDRNEVLQVALDTLQTLRSIPTGRGPASLALSHDGRTLAVANRLDATVTLIDLRTLAVSGTINVGKGPADITALPGGGFATADSFSDTVTLIDAQSATATATVAAGRSVPVAIASSSRYLAIATRQPPQVALYATGASEPDRVVELKDVPIAIEAMPDGRFVVAVKSSVSVIADTGEVEDLAATVPTALVLTETGFLVASGVTLEFYDSNLALVDAWTSPSSVQALASSPGFLVALSLTEKTAYTRGHAEIVAAQAPPLAGPPSTPKPSPAAPVVEEAENVAPPPAATLPAAPPPEQESIAAPPPAPQVDVSDEQTPGPSASDRDPQSDSSKQTPKPRQQIRPEFNKKPGPVPLGGNEAHAPALAPASQQTFTEALSSGATIGEGELGFIVPDLSQPIEDPVAGILEGDLEGNLSMSEGFRFRIGDTFFEGESLSREITNGTVEASGSVNIEQADSSLTATRLKYTYPIEAPGPLEDEATPRLLSTPETPEDRQQRLVRQGKFEAEGIHLIEPSRELQADFVQYDLASQTGEIFGAKGKAGVVYFNAASLRVLGPDEFQAEDLWVTTCDLPVPHYRLALKNATVANNQVVLGTNARLQLGAVDTPFFVPKWSAGYRGNRDTSLDFDTGRNAETGTFVNVGLWFKVTEHLDLALRFMPTQKEGLGMGVDMEYDFMNATESRLFRSKGSLRTLYTTHERGYTEFYHRTELSDRTVVLAQTEQWYDRDFVKDFFYDAYRDRTGPRTFVNLTHITKSEGVLTLSASKATHDFTREAEKLPEFTYHHLERELAKDLYLSFDTYNGYYESFRRRQDDKSGRSINIARLTYDWNAASWLNIAPFAEGGVSWYSRTRDDENSEVTVNGVGGVTVQSRFQRTYGGVLGFSEFKHIVVPSMTYSYRAPGGINIDDVPKFDALDDVPGRSRVETKIDNILLGKDAETGETWPVARVSAYTGNDFSNEDRRSQDYEMEIDIRPRSWWGFQTVGEHHGIENERDFLDYFPLLNRAREAGSDIREQVDDEYLPDDQRGDFNRVLALFYYDDAALNGNFNARLGYAYTETDKDIFNREVLYGMGYRINDKWSLAFEHRYDFERDELVRQSYEIRRRLHCWEATFQIRDRQSGFDVGIEFSLTAFPGARVKF